MTQGVTDFTHAITRRPSASVISGLRANDTGNPDVAVFLDDHARYIGALKASGASVTELSAMEDYPDSVFVEDAALCLPQGAVAMRPGAPSRLGEAAEMEPVLRGFYDDVRIIGHGHIEGGDILVTEREILVGLSVRTDQAGVDALCEAVADWGWSVRVLQTPPDVLHFKTDCGLLDAQTILATNRLARSGCFDGYRVIEVVAGEEPCANCVCFNDVVLFPRGYPETSARLKNEG